MNYIEERRNICNKCPLNADDICNSKLYLNPKDNTISFIEREGYYRGCGCYLPSKIEQEWNHCPLKKW